MSHRKEGPRDGNTRASASLAASGPELPLAPGCWQPSQMPGPADGSAAPVPEELGRNVVLPGSVSICQGTSETFSGGDRDCPVPRCSRAQGPQGEVCALVCGSMFPSFTDLSIQLHPHSSWGPPSALVPAWAVGTGRPDHLATAGTQGESFS